MIFIIVIIIIRHYQIDNNYCFIIKLTNNNYIKHFIKIKFYLKIIFYISKFDNLFINLINLYHLYLYNYKLTIKNTN